MAGFSGFARASTPLAIIGALLISGASAAATPPANLALRWRIESNDYPPAAPHPASNGALEIRNLGAKALATTGWSLWFTSAAELRAGDTVDHLRIERLNGSLYRMFPVAGFTGIDPGARLIVRLPYTEEVVKDTEAPQGPYWVLDSAPDAGHPIVQYAIEPRTLAEQLPRDRPGMPALLTPDAVYARNEGIADLPVDALPPVFPTPIEAARGTGALHWSRRPRIDAGPGLGAEVALATRFLAHALPAATGNSAEPPVRMAIAAVKGHAGAESYRLVVDPQAGVTLTGNSAAGVSRGLQSLRELLPAEASVAGADVPAWTITDEPRFGYRGLALDLARNFQPRDVVVRYLELMARYKLNTLHLHLSDDEGWRLQVAGLPELTAVGARRGHSNDPLRHLPPAHGSGASVDDPHGSGYLTRADFKEIIRHAAALRIAVIPEIEMPGHSRAAVKAMESRARRLGRAGNAGAEKYRLADPADTSVYESAQQFNDNVMNPGLESTYAFIDHVIGDVAAMYREAGVPLPTIHVGGDELPSGAWSRSPACDALLRREHLAGTADLWNYFYGRVHRLLQARGLAVSGWEEIGSRRVRMHGASKLIPNPEFVHAGMTVYVWNNLGDAVDLGVRLANAGYRTVLTPVSAFYFDMAYNRNPDEPGGKWAPFIDLDAAYDFVPYDFVRSSPTDPAPVPGRDGLADFGRERIAGLEGQLWAESLREVSRIDYMLMPRLLGLAERAWAPDPEWARTADRPVAERLHANAWSMFVNQLGKQVLPRLDAEHAGVAYRIPPPGLRRDGVRVLANLQLPGFVLRYTTDGTDPTRESPEVSGPIAARAVLRVAAFDRNDRVGRVSQVDNR